LLRSCVYTHQEHREHRVHVKIIYRYDFTQEGRTEAR